MEFASRGGGDGGGRIRLALMIDPDYFGCSGKLGFAETAEYRRAFGPIGSEHDYSTLPLNGVVATSIDKVSRCSEDWRTFAEIALNHVLADIEVGFFTPRQISIAYEFGPDAQKASDRAKAVAAFATAISERQLMLGKSHSAVSYGPTAVTVAVLGDDPMAAFAKPDSGSIILERPIGFFKLHYMNEMGLATDLGQFTENLMRPRGVIPYTKWAGICDVSGHGLLGALLSMAEFASVDIRIDLSPILAADPRVLDVPIQCLENPAESYGKAIELVDPRALSLATLRETAGPLVGLLERANGVHDTFGASSARAIGEYQRGTGKVEINWTG